MQMKQQLSVGTLTSRKPDLDSSHSTITTHLTLRSNIQTPYSVPKSHNGPYVMPNKRAGTDRGATTDRGRSSICTRWPGLKITGLRPRATSNRGHSISGLFFCKPESMKSYGTQLQATSISTRLLIVLNIMIGLWPRATSNRGRSISWPRIRPLSVVA